MRVGHIPQDQIFFRYHLSLEKLDVRVPEPIGLRGSESQDLTPC